MWHRKGGSRGTVANSDSIKCRANKLTAVMERVHHAPAEFSNIINV